MFPLMLKNAVRRSENPPILSKQMLKLLKGFSIALALAALLLLPSPSFACSACRDVSAGSAPQARAGLRKGILVLGIPAAGIFAGILVLGFRIKPRSEGSENDRIHDQHQREV